MKNTDRLACFLLAGLAGGCFGNLSNFPFEDDLAFVEALPDASTLYVETPAGGDDQGSSEKCSDTNLKTTMNSDGCDPDLLRTWTYETTADVNAFILNVLDLLDRIRSAEPDQRTKNSRIWGPWYLDDLGIYVRLEVIRAEPVFTYDLTLSHYPDRDRDILLSGSWAPGSNAEDGRGEFVFDYDVQSIYFADATQTGTLVVQYDTTGPLLDLRVSAYNLVDPDTGDIVDNEYAYYREGQGVGYFYFQMLKDVYNASDEANTDEEATPKQERISLWSVWDETSAGRSDLQITGGDLGETIYSGIECWTPDQNPVYSVFPGCEETGDLAFCKNDVIGWNDD